MLRRLVLPSVTELAVTLCREVLLLSPFSSKVVLVETGLAEIVLMGVVTSPLVEAIVVLIATSIVISTVVSAIVVLVIWSLVTFLLVWLFLIAT